ncbi:hypothetical protein [Cytobacillus purgationiresistens]|uniref:Uncharacterized protein n=1 Tax=Cytobacillus purgationiresistens TaxID=863449 RepID=A0ABU0AVE5_9BACI|nr:hypothetical protein [Cytobacillus purgationiresistens]MDQ0273965.1 hypothetical protein [Cytobacillus purgationiresistens]
MNKLRNNILNTQDISSENLYIPEWKVEVEVRGLSGSARNRILSNALNKKGEIDLNAMYPDLIIASLFEPGTNERIFGPEDRDILNAKSGKALERIARVAMDLSGLNEGQVEEKVKN